jgi:hypothetical protein
VSQHSACQMLRSSRARMCSSRTRTENRPASPGPPRTVFQVKLIWSGGNNREHQTTAEPGP